MKLSLKSTEIRFNFGLGLFALLAILAIIGGYVTLDKLTTPTEKEAKAGLLVFKPATVKLLVNERTVFSDGDGIEVTVYPTKTAIDPEKLLQSPEWFGFSVYRVKDHPKAKEEIFFLSKKSELRGCENYKLRCVLHKNHEGLKFLEEVVPK